MKKIKFTVITVCLNSSSTIKKTIQSVLNQSHENFEYIIWDGFSKDNTAEIIKSFLYDPRIKFVQGIDSGPGDATNKCFKLAKGNIIQFLGSDDYLINKNVLRDVSNKFNEEIDAVYGNISYHGGNLKRKWIVGNYYNDAFLNGWAIPFPTFFFKRKLIEKYGLLDNSIKIADDHDFIFRLVHVKKIKIIYLNKFLVSFYHKGRSGNFISRLISIQDTYRIFKKYNIKVNIIMFLIKKYLIKASQFSK